jgi:hypothetical protein
VFFRGFRGHNFVLNLFLVKTNPDGMKRFFLHRYGPLLLCGLLLVTGGQTRADDLVSVYRLALDADPQYQAALEAHKAALEVVPQSRAAVLSNEKAVEAAETGFEVGTRAVVDVLDAQRELLRARRDYARSRYDYLLDTLRLKQAAGILHETDLIQINNWLEEYVPVPIQSTEQDKQASQSS